MTYTISMHEPEYDESGEIDNVDRGAMVAPLVSVFEAAYYHGGAETVQTIVQDMISDLLHYLQHASEFVLEECIEPGWTPEAVAERAIAMFIEEREMQTDDMTIENLNVTTADEARETAIRWQHWSTANDRQLSMGELAEWGNYFEGLAQRFPELDDEFRENAII